MKKTKKRFNDLKVNFHYTSLCDMNCCFCFAKYNNKPNKEQVISTFMKLMKTTDYINLVGGEVFTNIDLLVELVEIGVENNKKLSLVTNGYKLANKLDDSRIKYILANLCTIGISVDTFNENTNIDLGRCVSKNVLTKDMFENIVKYCNGINLQVKVNTVVYSYNKDENLADYLRTLNITKWKRFQVVTYNKEELNELAVSNEDFERYCTANVITKIDCRNESVSVMNDSYLICNQEGYFYLEEENKNLSIDNIIDEKDENKKLDLIAGIGFNLNNYIGRYKQNLIDLHIHTNHSDGVLEPKQIIKIANEKELNSFSITDHDTALSYEDKFVRDTVKLYGIELSCTYKEKKMHVLAYTNEYHIIKEVEQITDRLPDEVYEDLYQKLKSKYPKLERITKKSVTRKDYTNELVKLGYFDSFSEAREADYELYKMIDEPKLDVIKLKEIHDNSRFSVVVF